MNGKPDEELEPDDDSRRSFMKKGVLASSAAALGFAGSGSVTGETSDDVQRLQQQPGTALAFVNDYHPGVSFQVISRIQQPTVNQILGYVDPAQGNGEAVVDPTDYDGYIYNYTQCGPGNYNIVFIRDGTLQQGQTYSFATDATFFSNSQQLLETSIQMGGGGGGNQTAGNQTGGNATAPSSAERP